jgi:hypothetical protein
MTEVNTVRGPVDGGRLGRTLMHEHIFVLSPEMEKTADEWDEAAEQSRAVTKLRDLKDRGIDTLVDLTVIGLGRYIPRVAAIADKVPEINVVVATGVYTYNEVPMYFHFQGPGTILGGPEPMVDVFLREIREGIGETGVRAGILKCASDRPGITPGVERVLRAVAQAHRATGVPITTHTPPQRRDGQHGLPPAPDRQRLLPRLRSLRPARHHPGGARRRRRAAVRPRLRRADRPFTRRHVLRRLVPPRHVRQAGGLALDVHLRRGAPGDAGPGHQRPRHRHHAGGQPPRHPRRRRPLLMHRRGARA